MVQNPNEKTIEIKRPRKGYKETVHSAKNGTKVFLHLVGGMDLLSFDYECIQEEWNGERGHSEGNRAWLVDGMDGRGEGRYVRLAIPSTPLSLMRNECRHLVFTPCR